MKISALTLVLLLVGAAGVGAVVTHVVTPQPPAAPVVEHGPWEDYRPAPVRQSSGLFDDVLHPAPKTAPADDQIARINADLARDRQVEEDAKVQARAIADELRR